MSLIDDEGRLFGVVNVIDAAVFVCLLAAAIGAVAFVTAPSSSATEHTTVTISADVPPQATAELQRLAEDSDTRIADVRVIQTWYNDTERRQFDRVRVTAFLELRTSDGRYYHQGERVAIGSEFELDARRVIVDGRVTKIVPQEVAADAE